MLLCTKGEGFGHEDGGSMFLRNVSIDVQVRQNINITSSYDFQ
jgi:hypothetical protein